MLSRPLLLLGNLAAILVTIAAFLQAVSWSIAGVLILVSLILPLLANISPSRGSLTSHPASKIPTLGPQSQARTDQRQLSKGELPRTLGPKGAPKLIASTVIAPKVDAPKIAPTTRPPIEQGPNFKPTIANGDYVEYDVVLDVGEEFSGEVTATGLVNVYLLDEDNLDNLAEGEEFWSEIGEEDVETAKLEFTAETRGTWFFVVENVDDQPVSATVKLKNASGPKALAE